MVTNGELFQETPGKFTEMRQAFGEFYPEDLRKKKLAMHCALAAQSGQYNYARCAHRGEMVAAYLASAEFIQHAQAIIFLLNKKYRPYYKWTHRAMKGLPVLGAAAAPKIEALAGNAEFHVKVDLIEEISAEIIKELRKEGLSSSRSDFLLQHAEEVQRRIEDPQLRAMHLMAE